MSQRSCRCEKSIPAVILDGYSCGNPQCWRTAEVQRSFDAFVEDLVRNREEMPSAHLSASMPD